MPRKKKSAEGDATGSETPAATKRNTKAKSATKSKAKGKAPRKTKYEKEAEKTLSPWIAYAGNKRQLVPIIADYMPGPVRWFVDLFGGTGITGIEMYKRGMCKQVIYNDLEYDMVLLLEWMYVTPIAEIKRQYNAARERWFGYLDYIQAFPTDDKDYKKAFKEEHGLKKNQSIFSCPDYQPGPHVIMWRALVDHYNKNRLILWDRPEDIDIRKILETVEDPDIREQLNWFVNGVPAESVRPMGMDPKKAEGMTEEEIHQAWLNSMENDPRLQEIYSPERLATIRERLARDHIYIDGGIDVFAARGDFFIPAELMLIMLHSFNGIQHWGRLGRSMLNYTPRLSNSNNKAAGKLKDIDDLVPFIEQLKKTPMRFFSHSFTEGWIKKKHERERTKLAQKKWDVMLGSLGPDDLVFIDPPYHGSKAAYNNVYNQQLEIYLFSLCQLLTERGVPWILTDNLKYENDIFKGWINDYYAYQLKPGALKLYSGNKEASDGEVLVSNYKPSTGRVILKTMLDMVPAQKGARRRGLLPKDQGEEPISEEELEDVDMLDVEEEEFEA